LVLIGGEITTDTYIDFKKVAQEVLVDLGYTNGDYGIDAHSCAIINSINEQSPDISQGVTEGKGLHKEQGAGDQGIMFGYANTDTPELMPAPIQFSHNMMKQASKARRDKTIPYLRPDGKGQVSVEYKDGKPSRIHTVVLSHQHDPEIQGKVISIEQIQKDFLEKIIKPALPTELLDDNTIFHINPTGRFVVGGPTGDAGLTGRKIIVDTYGGRAAHGGGAFSGKDPSKVDRSGAYMARYIAKNLVATGLMSEVEVQLSYAIGVAAPTSIYINTFESCDIPEDKLEQVVRQAFPLTPGGIIDHLKLKRPIYRQTASFGHFGRENLPWEQRNKVEELKSLLS
jgi:S-adenosylmethionine synthetase